MNPQDRQAYAQFLRSIATAIAQLADGLSPRRVEVSMDELDRRMWGDLDVLEPPYVVDHTAAQRDAGLV
jgi:hypothetical protein